MKFTKGNTVAAHNKLKYLQERYARKYTREGGRQFESMVESVFDLAKQHLGDHRE